MTSRRRPRRNRRLRRRKRPLGDLRRALQRFRDPTARRGWTRSVQRRPEAQFSSEDGPTEFATKRRCLSLFFATPRGSCSVFSADVFPTSRVKLVWRSAPRSRTNPRRRVRCSRRRSSRSSLGPSSEPLIRTSRTSLHMTRASTSFSISATSCFAGITQPASCKFVPHCCKLSASISGRRIALKSRRPRSCRHSAKVGRLSSNLTTTGNARS
mmetsp:Transcript_8897/g.27617  ORF Transcript_8897/g.27617 Transcript_8897/m.27617 type:complete len:212 (+) Transcript_8897:593-1228(+)